MSVLLWKSRLKVKILIQVLFYDKIMISVCFPEIYLIVFKLGFWISIFPVTFYQFLQPVFGTFNFFFKEHINVNMIEYFFIFIPTWIVESLFKTASCEYVKTLKRHVIRITTCITSCYSYYEFKNRIYLFDKIAFSKLNQIWIIESTDYFTASD